MPSSKTTTTTTKKSFSSVKSTLSKPNSISLNEKLIRPRGIKILIVGIGGGAASILAELSQGLKGPDFLILDTDKRSFKKCPSRVKKMIFGQSFTKGWGTGMNTEVGEKAVKEIVPKLKKVFENRDLIILISCLGGGVGSGAGPVVAEVVRESKKTSLGIFSLPFAFEGEKKMRIALRALEKIKPNLSGFIVLPNEEISNFTDKKVSLKQSLSLVNQTLIDYLKSLIQTISLAGLVNIDFADLKTILSGKGKMVFFGEGLGVGPNRAEMALNDLFSNPFFKKPSKISRILFDISSGGDLEIREVEKIGREIFKLNPRAKIIFGISKSPKLKKKIKITFLGAGEAGGRKEKKIQKEKKQAPTKKSKEVKKQKPQRQEPSSKPQKNRRSALEIKKEKEKEQEEEFFSNSEWEIPPFLKEKL